MTTKTKILIGIGSAITLGAIGFYAWNKRPKAGITVFKDGSIEIFLGSKRTRSNPNGIGTLSLNTWNGWQLNANFPIIRPRLNDKPEYTLKHGDRVYLQGSIGYKDSGSSEDFTIDNRL